WRELEVRRERTQAPTLVLSGKSKEIGLFKGGSRMLLSLTHEGEYALAQAILVGDQLGDRTHRSLRLRRPGEPPRDRGSARHARRQDRATRRRDRSAAR